MLHLKTVEPATFSLLNELMQLPALNDFALVGGTALSLKYGHRKSVDLDLFSTASFDNPTLYNALLQQFQSGFIVEDKPVHFGIFAYINEVKVDIVRHPYPLIRPLEVVDGIRMFSTEDIIAMKLQAILGRGKKKDFWDVAELLGHYTIDDFISFHKEKYSTQNLLITVPQAITYFVDAEESEDPISLKKQTWTTVKQTIQKQVRGFLQ